MDRSDDPRYKTELCNRFRERGYCKYGKRCLYAHGPEELRPSSRVFDPKYKTQRCKHWWETGKCPYAKRCRFIHRETPEQLRQLRRLHGVPPDDMPTCELPGPVMTLEEPPLERSVSFEEMSAQILAAPRRDANGVIIDDPEEAVSPRHDDDDDYYVRLPIFAAICASGSP